MLRNKKKILSRDTRIVRSIMRAVIIVLMKRKDGLGNLMRESDDENIVLDLDNE